MMIDSTKFYILIAVGMNLTFFPVHFYEKERTASIPLLQSGLM